MKKNLPKLTQELIKFVNSKSSDPEEISTSLSQTFILHLLFVIDISDYDQETIDYIMHKLDEMKNIINETIAEHNK